MALWDEFYKGQATCPLCGKSMATRVLLRWHNKCQQKPRKVVALDAAGEAQRREELERRVRESLAKRLGAPLPPTMGQ